jgi:hypothetical protein
MVQAVSGHWSQPTSVDAKITVNVRTGAVSVVVLAIAATIQLQSNDHWTG